LRHNACLIRSSANRSKEVAVEFNIVTIQPLVALVAGILILIMPRILNFIVAIYLIFIGVTGLWPNLLHGG